jgi:ribosomal protein S18 acetylase RimI-like enzyme
LKIRDATPADLPAIVRLLAADSVAAGRERPEQPLAPAYREAFDRMVAQPGNRQIVAELHGRVIGCLQLTIIHGLSRSGMTRAQIEGVRVDAGCRGQGIGEALFDYAIEAARGGGCGLVQLTTDKTRDGARRFYERLGFKASHEGMKLALE